MPRPLARGPLSERLLDAFDGPPRPVPRLEGTVCAAIAAAGDDLLEDDDLQLSLTMLYELHYRGLDGVDDRWEWSPAVIGARTLIEEPVERRLPDVVRRRVRVPDPPEDLPAALSALVATDDGPPLSEHLARSATVEQFREFLVHRSLYHLEEADPHTWAARVAEHLLACRSAGASSLLPAGRGLRSDVA